MLAEAGRYLGADTEGKKVAINKKTALEKPESGQIQPWKKLLKRRRNGTSKVGKQTTKERTFSAARSSALRKLEESRR